MIEIVISEHPLELASLSERIRRNDCGAIVTFEGSVRSPNQGQDVLHLEYEAYESVAASQMRQIAEQVSSTEELRGVVIAHRVGKVYPGETAFYVAACSPHRSGALTGTAHIVDRVKAEVAIWKKEMTRGTAKWATNEASNPPSGYGETNE